jgi:hypothetical protein
VALETLGWGILRSVDADSIVILTIVAMVVWSLWLPFQLAASLA